MKTLLIDPSKCIQCCNCQNSCKDEHCDNDWKPYAAEQESGQFWIQIRENQAACGSRMKLERTPVPCQHCADAPCMAAAVAAGAPDAVYRREDGLVIIDPEKAKGHKCIQDACPYGAVYYNEALDLPQKCTMCAHLLDSGWSQPRCVTACPTDALRFVDAEELSPENLYAPLEILNPEFKTHPSVRYVNLPKPFLAGSLYSEAQNACVENARLTLKAPATGKVYEGRSRMLGEFKIEGVHPGFYDLEIDADGYEPKTIGKIDLRSAVNAGDINLQPVIKLA